MFRLNQKNFIVYLAGKIKKTPISDIAASSDFGWSAKEIAEVNEGLGPYRLIGLNPAERIDDIKDYVAVYGKDLLMVLVSDAILVDARVNCGMGIGAEMATASAQGIPVIATIPPGSVYHQFDSVVCGQHLPEYKHPFAWTLADKVVPDFVSMGKYMFETMTPEQRIHRFHLASLDKKTLTAIGHYFNRSYKADTPFISLCNQFPELNNRVEYFKDLTMMSPTKPLTARL